MAIDVSVECEYRLLVNGKKIAASRAELVALRDKLNDLLAGAIAPKEHDDQKLARWTDEDDAKLRQLMARGKPFAVIAEDLGRTESACRQRWQGLKSAT